MEGRREGEKEEGRDGWREGKASTGGKERLREGKKKGERKGKNTFDLYNESSSNPGKISFIVTILHKQLLSGSCESRNICYSKKKTNYIFFLKLTLLKWIFSMETSALMHSYSKVKMIWVVRRKWKLHQVKFPHTSEWKCAEQSL